MTTENVTISRAGVQGVPGASNGFPFTIDLSLTAMADPGPGKLRFNNATPALATSIFLAAESAATGNPDVSAIIGGLAAGRLTLVKQNDTSIRLDFTLASIASATGGLQLTVSGGAGTGTFADGDSCWLFVAERGANGVQSSDGSVPDFIALTRAEFEALTPDEETIYFVEP